ncbi:MAG TPA: ABC transporter permease [Candidatus Dormibacteraeota bacterium]
MANTVTPAPQPAPAAAQRRTSLSGLVEQLGGVSTLGPVVALAIAVIVFTLLSARFMTPGNLSAIVEQVMVVGTLAVGQTLIILTAGIDLSNGAIMVFSSILMAKLATLQGVPVPLAILIGLIAAAAVGAVNGGLVTRLKLPPFIVTLGMLNIVLSITLLYSHGASVVKLPAGLLFFGRFFELGSTRITYGSILMLLIFAVAWYALTQTAWGKHVYATGNNAEAARRSGIRVNSLLLLVYTIAGLIYGIAGLLLLGRVTVGDPLAGATSNLDSITAVVIGGTSLFGGRGSVINTLIGALIVGVLRNGLTLVGIDALYQTLATGILVILAVALDQLARSRAR